MGVRSPPEAPELAGTLPGVVGERECLQVVKGEVGGQLVQAVVLQMDVFQRGHTQEGIIGELGARWARLSTPTLVSSLSQLYGPRGAGFFPVFPGHKQWYLEECHSMTKLSPMI